MHAKVYDTISCTVRYWRPTSVYSTWKGSRNT